MCKAWPAPATCLLFYYLFRLNLAEMETQIIPPSCEYRDPQRVSCIFFTSSLLSSVTDITYKAGTPTGSLGPEVTTGFQIQILSFWGAMLGLPQSRCRGNGYGKLICLSN